MNSNIMWASSYQPSLGLAFLTSHFIFPRVNTIKKTWWFGLYPNFLIRNLLSWIITTSWKVLSFENFLLLLESNWKGGTPPFFHTLFFLLWFLKVSYWFYSLSFEYPDCGYCRLWMGSFLRHATLWLLILATNISVPSKTKQHINTERIFLKVKFCWLMKYGAATLLCCSL